MKAATLIRLEHGDWGTFGALVLDGKLLGPTLEPPWLHNHPNVSCIPEGTYLCERVESSRFRETFEIVRVPGRDRIRFPWGNTVNDTEGCPILGSFVGELRGRRAVLASKRAFTRFMDALEGERAFRLQIISMRFWREGAGR